MLLKCVNMADVARGKGYTEAQILGKAAPSRLQAGPGSVAGGKTSVIAAPTVSAPQTVPNVGNVGNVPAVGLSDSQLGGVRLDQRAELESLAVLLLDQGLSVAEVYAALQEFAKHKQWAPLSPVNLQWIVGSAADELVIAELEEEEAQQAASLVPRPDELLEISLADVRPQPVRWLWPGKIPLGRVTVIYGEEGIGKTSLGLELAARVSAGTHWPDQSGAPEPGRVLIVNGEDPLAEAIHPRLTSSGAKLQNISIIAGMQSAATPGTPGSPGVAAGGAGGATVRGVSGVREASGVRRFDLGRDLSVLRRRVEALGNVRLVIIDPFEACCGKAGSNRMKLRELVAALSKLAADYGVAIVVMSAAARCDLPVKNVWRVDCDVLDDGLRCWVPVRCNWGDLPAGLAFRVTSDKIVWEARSESPTADRSRGATAQQEKSRQLKEHAEWLKTHLADGPLPAKQVLAAASTAGWSAGQVRRAREALRVVCSKETVVNGQWVWELRNRPDRTVAGRVNLYGESSGLRVEDVEDVEHGKGVEDVVMVSA